MRAQAMLDRKVLNDEVVVPAYREFCRANGLAFHFWDELPENAFDAQTARRESGLHHEAMDLFNRMKPEFIVRDGFVVRYQFTSWDGDFEYSSWPIEEFLSNTANEAISIKSMKRSFEIVLCALLLLASIALAVFLGTFAGDVIPDSILIPAVLVGGAALVWWFVERRPIWKRQQDQQRLRHRLDELRKKFDQNEPELVPSVNALVRS